jgi:hypothetical protein
LLFHGAGGRVQAQWRDQTIPLQPGWNAVFLEVQPQPRAADAVFAGLPVESVWAWNRRFTPVQFVQDPTTLTPAQPDWLVYLPPNHPLSSQVSLFAIEGGRPYLIRLRTNATPMNWTLRGQPVVRRSEWVSDSLNFVGFNLPTTSLPNFEQFFSSSTAHAGQPIYRLSANGTWSAISSPATTAMRNGEAFWIRTAGRSDFAGPLQLVFEQQQQLDFGRVLKEQTLVIRNNSLSTRTLTVRKLASAQPASGEQPALAGDVPLSYWDVAASGWRDFVGPLTKSGVPAGGEWTLRLAVRRNDMMTALARQAGAGEGRYQSLLEVSDSANSARHTVAVAADGSARTGLWIGGATIKHVNQPANVSNPNQPVPTASEFQFRLLVHVDGNGQARLLQKVLQMWKDGTYKPDPAGSGNQVVDEPGRFVLVTDDSLTSQFTGAALRDGEPVARRFSSAAFGFRQPIAMTGAGGFGGAGSTRTCLVPLDYDDPVNPFKHRYHPDHDNLDPRFEQKLGEGREGFTVTREVQLQFAAQDPDNLTLAGWGDNHLGGVYRETITGLHQAPLIVEGTFRLHHATDVATLNQ